MTSSPTVSLQEKGHPWSLALFGIVVGAIVVCPLLFLAGFAELSLCLASCSLSVCLRDSALASHLKRSLE